MLLLLFGAVEVGGGADAGEEIHVDVVLEGEVFVVLIHNLHNLPPLRTLAGALRRHHGA